MKKMLSKLRAGLSQIGGTRVVLATLAIAWGLNTIQKVVDEQTVRLAALAEAENEIASRLSPQVPDDAAALFENADVLTDDQDPKEV